MSKKTICLNNYHDWINMVESNYDLIDIANMEYQPVISIVYYATDITGIVGVNQMVESIKRQSYKKWDLHIIVNQVKDNEDFDLSEIRCDNKIEVHKLPQKESTEENFNELISNTKGEYVIITDSVFELYKEALANVVSELNEFGHEYIYSDEDFIDSNGVRINPYFKPDWSPNTMLSMWYTGKLGIYKKDLMHEIGGIRFKNNVPRLYDLNLRFTENTKKIGHIAKILFHNIETNSNENHYDDEIEDLRDALIRRKINGEVCQLENPRYHRINYVGYNNSKVSIIIPSKDNFDILKQCIVTLVEKTQYDNYEIIVVDNGSSDENRLRYSELLKKYCIKYIYEPEKFNFSHMCNVGAQSSTGEYLLFLNDDIEIIEGTWLDRMLGQASLDYVGAVGAKLLYPGAKKIQHVGVVTNPVGPSHAFAGETDDKDYYYGKNVIDTDYVAVTGACLLLSREKYTSVGGFDEDMPIAYNDVDLCFKLLKRGLYNVVRNDAVLIHHESVSRGHDGASKEKLKRLKKERTFLYKKHPQYEDKDPFYNINLTQHQVDFDYNLCSDLLRCNSKKLSPLLWRTCCESFDISIDYMKCEEYLTIRGWFFYKDDDTTGNCNIHVLLLDENEKIMMYNSYRIDRHDVAAEKGFKQEFCGFESKIDTQNLNLDGKKYRIGLCLNSGLFKNAICWSDKYVGKDDLLDIEREKITIAEYDKMSIYDKYVIDKNNDEILTGWAVDTTCKDNDSLGMQVLFKIGNEYYMQSVVREKRNDVRKLLGLKHCKMSGFRTRALPELVEEIRIGHV